MTSKEAILEQFRLFQGGTGGIDSWLTPRTSDRVFERLQRLSEEPIRSEAQVNQLLTLSHEAPLSSGFYRYYWFERPDLHVYDVTTIPKYKDAWSKESAIVSLDQLYWGLYRFYVDSLLFFGNVRTGYQRLRGKSRQELIDFFRQRRSDTDYLMRRGKSLDLRAIPKDDRYLISEMACKSWDPAGQERPLVEVLREAFEDHVRRGGGRVTVGELLAGSYVRSKHEERRQQLLFSADEVLDQDADSWPNLEEKLAPISRKFQSARSAALENTQTYLSTVGDLDVYVATSMRSRKDFRDMASFCQQVFGSPRLKALDVRYFDPTLSAAENHEDKGIIECLMVKVARALVYCAGDKESYGKDAEAAMALSLGKPVIFFCSEAQKSKFYKETHPLSRLVCFETGVVVGAIVTSHAEEVSELLADVMENRLDYELEQKRPGYLHLLEKRTRSVVRLQTSDKMLRETFWNNYHMGVRG